VCLLGCGVSTGWGAVFNNTKVSQVTLAPKKCWVLFTYSRPEQLKLDPEKLESKTLGISKSRDYPGYLIVFMC